MFDLGPRSNCPDCAVEPGQAHQSGCDIQRCSVCGSQRLTCESLGRHPEHDPQSSFWTGYWPGELEAAEKGWFVAWTRLGWVACDSSVKGAKPDLNGWVSGKQTDNFEQTRDRIVAEAARYVRGDFPDAGKEVTIDGMGLGFDTRHSAILGSVIDIERVVGRLENYEPGTVLAAASKIFEAQLRKQSIWADDATIESILAESVYDISFAGKGIL